MHIRNDYHQPGTRVLWFTPGNSPGQATVQVGTVRALEIQVTKEGTSLLHRLEGISRSFVYEQLMDIGDAGGRGWWPASQVGELLLRELGVIPSEKSPVLAAPPYQQVLAEGARYLHRDAAQSKPIPPQPEAEVEEPAPPVDPLDDEPF